LEAPNSVQSAQLSTVPAAKSQSFAVVTNVPTSHSVGDATQELGFVTERELQKAKPVLLASARHAGQVAKDGAEATAWHAAEVVARVPPQASLARTQPSGDEEQKP
jgi:hypothetical protein